MKSLEEHLHDLFWTETNSQPWLKHIEQNCVINYNLEAYLLKHIKYAWPLTYTDSRKDK